ncbi:MAG: DUF222 domain-containing protein [Acidimicrobiales bacterium]
MLGFLAGLERAQGRLQAVASQALATADELGVAAELGHRSTAAAVGWTTNADPRSIGKQVSLGRWLREFPIVAREFQQGRLTRRHVEVLQETDNPRTRALLIEGQGHLSDAAATCAFSDFTHVVAEWAMRAEPDGYEPKEQRNLRRCSITRHVNGTVTGSFSLDALTGEAFVTAPRTRVPTPPGCRGGLRRLVLDAESEILDLGRTVRNFPRKFREALIAATRGRCQHAGCDAKVAWLEADHVQPWAHRGTTDLTNAQVLCGWHNKWKGDRTDGHPPGDGDEPDGDEAGG